MGFDFGFGFEMGFGLGLGLGLGFGFRFRVLVGLGFRFGLGIKVGIKVGDCSMANPNLIPISNHDPNLNPKSQTLIQTIPNLISFQTPF